MIIEVDVATKEPREFRGRKQYGVKPVGKDYWITLEVDFRPTKGMRFDVQMKETEKDGKTYRNATIIGPAPDRTGSVTEQFQAEKQALRTPEAAEAMQNLVPPPQSPANSQPDPLNQPSGKIKWMDWERVALAAGTIAEMCALEMDSRGAFINTTMIAFSNGKLELPVVALPATTDAEGNPFPQKPSIEDDIPG